MASLVVSFDLDTWRWNCTADEWEWFVASLTLGKSCPSHDNQEAALPGERLANLPPLYLSRVTPLESRRHNA